MPMDPFTMEIPWAGSLSATIKVVNGRIIEAVNTFAKANKITPKQVVVRYQGSKNSVLTGRTFAYSVEKTVVGIGRIDQ